VNWTDAGVNWLDPRLAKRHDALIDGALAHSVNRILAICCDPRDLKLIESLSALPHKLEAYFTVGLHPHYASPEQLGAIEKELTSLVAHPRCVAVGETGLDYYRMLQPKNQQLAVFETQLAWSKQYQLPVYLHQRDAFNDVLGRLRDANINQGLAHCFTDGTNEMKGFLDQGLFIGITGWLCDERRNIELQEAVKYLPLDRLILETDAPYLTPRDLRPRPKSSCNLPQYIPHIAKRVAEIKGVSIETVNAAAEHNFEQLFRCARR